MLVDVFTYIYYIIVLYTHLIMEFSKIKHPQTNELYSIFSKQGKALLRYYVKAFQSGGSSEINDGQGPNLPYTSEEENTVGYLDGIDNDTITRELGGPNTNTSSEEESEEENKG